MTAPFFKPIPRLRVTRIAGVGGLLLCLLGQNASAADVLVVTDSRRAGGGFLEQVGFFNPVARGNSEELRLDLARVDYWLGVGAQPSDRVQQLLKVFRKTQVAAAA